MLKSQVRLLLIRILSGQIIWDHCSPNNPNKNMRLHKALKKFISIYLK